MSERVFITGLGQISAAGNDVQSALASMKNGERHVGSVSLFECPLDLPVFEVRDFPVRAGCRTLHLVEQALEEALESASLHDLSSLRVGVALGTTVACQLNDIDFYRAMRGGADPLKNAESPDAVDTFLASNLAEAIARRVGATGPQITIGNACSSGADAIGAGLSWLRSGLCDVVIAGGADELNRVPLSGFNCLSVASDSPCAPFDAGRTGLNLGEGAGLVILERESSALKRGVSASVELCGYGSSADAYHMTAPHPEGAGLERAILQALGEAGIAPADIAFVNAHGTATRENDRVEGNTLFRLFGESLVMLSTKGYTGHTLGAAGGIEAVFSAAALREGWIPASAGFCQQDPDIPLRPVCEVTALRGGYALSTSLAFGGQNAALVLRRI
jgi:3-oxoacyl-[acyl-carrier-protein] synthase II